MFNGKKLFDFVISYTKAITTVWLLTWVETILFSQVATIFNLGDAMSIQCINDNVLQVGLLICGFYFGKSMIENIAKGIETYLLCANGKEDLVASEQTPESADDVSDNEQDTTMLDDEPIIADISITEDDEI